MNSTASIIDRPASLRRLRAAATALITLLAALILAACDPTAEPAVNQSASERPVRVTEARSNGVGERIRLPGALRATHRAELAFLNDGTLQQRRVVLGEQVAEGAQLATLYNPALQPALAAALADVREASTRLEQLETDTRRQATLVDRNLISEDDLEQTRTRRDAARASLEQAEARLDQARAQLDDAALRAPFEGRIARFHAEPGDFVRAGQPVMMLTGEALEVEVLLRPAIAARLALEDRPTYWFRKAGRGLMAASARSGAVRRAPRYRSSSRSILAAKALRVRVHRSTPSSSCRRQALHRYRWPRSSIRGPATAGCSGS